MSGTRPTLADLGIERVPWQDLGPAFMRSWGLPGGRFDPEHLTVYGKSGSGKSYFVSYILRQRALIRNSHIVVVATKKTDSTISALGWPIVTEWPPGYGNAQCIFWAKAKGLSPAGRLEQRQKVSDLMDKLWVPNSNIVVYWDELAYVEQMLKLKPQIENFYREGRALGITNVASMQRPVWVSRLAHSEAGWSVAFAPKDETDRDRVAEVFGNRGQFRDALDALDRGTFEFLIRHDRSGNVYASHLPPPTRNGVRSRRP